MTAAGRRTKGKQEQHRKGHPPAVLFFYLGSDVSGGELPFPVHSSETRPTGVRFSFGHSFPFAPRSVSTQRIFNSRHGASG